MVMSIWRNCFQVQTYSKCEVKGVSLGFTDKGLKKEISSSLVTGEWLDSSELIGRQRNSNSYLLQAIDAEERLQTRNT